jgi:hypothetical protein
MTSSSDPKCCQIIQACAAVKRISTSSTHKGGESRRQSRRWAAIYGVFLYSYSLNVAPCIMSFAASPYVAWGVLMKRSFRLAVPATRSRFARYNGYVRALRRRALAAAALALLFAPASACRPSSRPTDGALAIPVAVPASSVDASVHRDDGAAAADDFTPRGPGRRLLAARSMDAGLVAPPDWIEERRALAGIWPARPAISLHEAWVSRLGTVCRTASWAAPMEEVARDADPRVAALARAASASSDEASRTAESRDDGARVRLLETRQRMGHMGQGGLSAPLTELFICVDGVSSPTASDAARVFLPAVPSSAATLPVLDLADVNVLTAELTRRRPGAVETSIHLVLSNDAQTRVAGWLVANGLASPHPTIPWAFDSADRRRSFIFYPPRGENLVEIAGR